MSISADIIHGPPSAGTLKWLNRLVDRSKRILLNGNAVYSAQLVDSVPGAHRARLSRLEVLSSLAATTNRSLGPCA